jgi:aldose sugar dehydrogenase
MAPPLRLLLVLTLVPASSACRCTQAQGSGGAQETAPGCELVEEGFGPRGEVPVRVEVVARGLEVPWGIAWLPGGDALVTERPGRVRLLRASGELVPEPVATVEALSTAEGGLLGIAAHPDFARTRQFYLYFTRREGRTTHNRVERWVLGADGRSAQHERVLLDGIPAAQLHDGGRLRFGPDGMLYVGTGDAREPSSSQELGSLSGKLLRLTPDGEVPQDNPFPGSPVFLLGIRNTQGFDWLDRDTLVVTDHGPSGDLGLRGHDEVDVARKGDNLGWPTLYGCQSREGMVSPVLTWRMAVPPGGAAVYTGDSIPEWRGSVLVATLGSEHLHRVRLTPGPSPRLEGHEVYLQEQYGRLREAIMGPDGHLYLTTSNCDGRGDCPREKDAILRVRR